MERKQRAVISGKRIFCKRTEIRRVWKSESPKKALRTAGDPGNVDFGCPGVLSFSSFSSFFQIFEKFRAAEIDFSGMSGGPRWHHSIRHTKKCQKPKSRVWIDFWCGVSWEGRAKITEKSKKNSLPDIRKRLFRHLRRSGVVPFDSPSKVGSVTQK